MKLVIAMIAMVGLTACTTKSKHGTHVPLTTQNEPTATDIGGAGLFDWPLDSARLTQQFKPKVGRKRPHNGIDLASAKGTSIFAAQDGKVIYVGREFHGYGRLVIIEGKDQYSTFYAHLLKYHVKQGQMVTKGQRIGDMGRSGRATGTHLHFEIRRNREPVDPLAYLPNPNATHQAAITSRQPASNRE